MKKCSFILYFFCVLFFFVLPLAANAQNATQIPLNLKDGTVMIQVGSDYETLKSQIQQAMGSEKPTDLSANRIAYQYKEEGSGENIMIYFLFEANGKLEEAGLCSMSRSANKPAQRLKKWLRANVGEKKPEEKKGYKKTWGPFIATWEPKEPKHEKKKRLKDEFWEAAGFRISEECYGDRANTCIEIKKK